MFNKKNDTWLKVTNFVLIITIVISLGFAIGNTIYFNSEDYEYYCPDYRESRTNDNLSIQSNAEDVQAENNVAINCKYLNQINEQEMLKEKYLGYTISVISLITLVFINSTHKREK